MEPEGIQSQTPIAFVSYSWEGETHQRWVEDLVARLRNCGIDLRFDQWELQPGDQLPQFMETAIRESDFVICVCTPRYKAKFDARTGGVGYEAHIMSAESLAKGKERKFIALLREGNWDDAAPSWLLGKKYLDFRGERYAENSFEQLIRTFHSLLPRAPAVRPIAFTGSAQVLAPEAITRQAAYGELVSAAFLVFSAAKRKYVLLKASNAASRLLLPTVEKELEASGNRVNELLHQIHLLSSESVRKAAGEIGGWVLMARMSSVHPKFEGRLDEAHQRLLTESMPRFKAAVRDEQGLR